MFRNYLKITFRNLKRHKGYSFINTAGLSVGMACFILILLFSQYEFSYEEHHQNAGRIYRVNVEQQLTDRVFRTRSSPVPLAETLHNELPEVMQFTRFESAPTVLVRHEDRRYYEDEVLFADPGILDMFTFPVLKGDKDTALKEPNTAVLTEEMALKYFGSQDAVGKSLLLDNQMSVMVTGVMKNHPKNSNIRPDFLVSFQTLRAIVPGDGYWNNWISQQLESYILLVEGHSVAEMEKKIAEVFNKYKREDDKRVLKLEQLKRMHLYSAVEDIGDIRTIYIFLATGLLILLIACINFMNLSTARSTNRAKEVGLRKVVGAVRRQLIKQFIGETLLFSAFSMILALILVYVFLPSLNALTGQFIRFEDIGRVEIILGLVGIVFLVGLLSGSYPALFLSAFQPANVLKGIFKTGRKGSVFRKVLVISQFSITIVLIVCTFILGRQLQFMRSKALGFKKDQILVMTNEGRQDIQPLKTALMQNPRILGVTGSLQLPSSIGMYNNVTWEGAPEGEEIELIHNTVDYDFLDTFEIELLAGRNFSPEFPSDSRSSSRGLQDAGAVILNQEAVGRFGWKDADAVGKKVIQTFGGQRIYYTVIGVIRDFHFSSLKNAIRPMNLFLGLSSNRLVSVKIQAQDVPGTLKFIEGTWNKLNPEYPIDYYFLDRVFERRYRSEERLRQLFGYFSVLAIFIACLGLFGLASFASEQRTKEIGIRKVLGAPVSGIVVLLSKEFTRWVLVANIIAWPLAYLAMHSWLRGFAYRININSQIGFFLAAAAGALIIAWLTVSFQAVKAALANPVDSLRYE
ncbi:MAG: ABC transporter permease [Candidatus Aminicenantes bacterium]|nr:ABC transporter permease [Candidatus Aminicenantes bacterium]